MIGHRSVSSLAIAAAPEMSRKSRGDTARLNIARVPWRRCRRRDGNVGQSLRLFHQNFLPAAWRHYWLLHCSGAKPCVLLAGNGTGILQAFELLDFIGRAVADHLAKLVARLLGPLLLALRHAAVL
jgi:hypothetical protein